VNRMRERQRDRERARSRNDIETMTAGVSETGWQACLLACWLAGWMVGWQAGSLPDKETGWRAGRGGERSGGAESAGEGVLGSARAERRGKEAGGGCRGGLWWWWREV